MQYSLLLPGVQDTATSSSCPQLLTPQGFLVQDWMEVSFPKHSRSSIQIGPLPPPYEDPVSTTPPLYSIKQSITKLCLIWSNMEILLKGFKILPLHWHTFGIPVGDKWHWPLLRRSYHHKLSPIDQTPVFLHAPGICLTLQPVWAVH